jgi:transcriptional regulator with XRE-family HTH domain
MANKHFSTYLRDTMERANMSQRELARASGLSSATVSRILSGQREVELKSATKLARGLGVPVEEVYNAAGFIPDKTSSDPWVEKMMVKLSSLQNEQSRRTIESNIQFLLSEEKHDRRRNEGKP